MAKNFKFGENIKCLKNLVVNNKQILGVAGSSDTVHLMTLEYFNEHKDELKGDKGDAGPQGPHGIQGPQGKNGLDGKDGEDGSAAKTWIWDLINTGLTAGSYGVLQYQVGKLWAIVGSDALKGLRDALKILDTGTNAFDKLGTFVRSTKEFCDNMTGTINTIQDTLNICNAGLAKKYRRTSRI